MSALCELGLHKAGLYTRHDARRLMAFFTRRALAHVFVDVLARGSHAVPGSRLLARLRSPTHSSCPLYPLG